MFRDIKKKKVILENRKPFEENTAAYMDEICRIGWVYSNLRLSGSSVTREQVEKIAKGGYITDVPLREHALISDCMDMFELIKRQQGMDLDLSKNVVKEQYLALFPQETAEFRTNNPVLVEWQYNPPHFKELEAELEGLFRWNLRETCDGNYIEKAVRFHNEFLRIYPFDTGTCEMARLALLYLLLAEGLPSFELTVTEQEYNDDLSRYLKKGDWEPLYEKVLVDLNKQLDIMLQLTVLDR